MIFIPVRKGRQERCAFIHRTPIILDYVVATKDFYNHLISLDMVDHELRHVIAENHAHNEEAWQARLPDIFQWLLEDAKGI